MTTDGEFVEQLENECEEALRDVVDENFEDFPPHVAHLMAKAAVTVLEAAMDREDFTEAESDDETVSEQEADSAEFDSPEDEAEF